ncbi:MAG: GNAT family N-acetyltransferase [Mycobacteriales bacterium]
MRDDVTIRDAGVADTPRLVALIAAGSIDGGPPDTDLAPYADAVRELADDKHSAILVAEIKASVVGMCQLIGFRHVQHRGGLCAEVESMHVDPARRGSGIGGLLLEAAVDRAREWGAYRVQLTSNVQRQDAHRFYARHGFVASHVGLKRALT